MATETIIAEVWEERKRQDLKWGGATHDDNLGFNDWHSILSDYIGWGRRMLDMGSPEKARKRFIQVAAIAVAVVEWIDRKREVKDGL